MTVIRARATTRRCTRTSLGIGKVSIPSRGKRNLVRGSSLFQLRFVFGSFAVLVARRSFHARTIADHRRLFSDLGHDPAAAALAANLDRAHDKPHDRVERRRELRPRKQRLPDPHSPEPQESRHCAMTRLDQARLAGEQRIRSAP